MTPKTHTGIAWLGLAVGLAVGLVGCASKPISFEDAPVLWYVADRHDIPQPEPRQFAHIGYFTDILVFQRLTRALEVRDLEPAHNTNALDELPNSTWFTNRIGVRTVTPQEAARGPIVVGPPVLPLRIVSGKSGGRNPGFTVEDASGRKFIIKFDRMDNPDQQSGTDVIVSRLFWAMGYHVPQDTLLYFDRDDVSLDPEATLQPELGKERKMTPEDLDEIFAASPRQHDGSYRVVASQFLPGVPLGGPPAEGTRPDDPNDLVPHQHRRELRGLRVFSAWLNHTDIKEDNLLDMYVSEDGRQFVRHYLVDFGEALGAHRAEFNRPEDGFEFIVDWEKQSLALLSLGFWERPWEAQVQTPWPSIGMFSAEHFDPERWREAYPFWPFFEMTPADAYWAAKIVMRFDREILEAVVDEAQFSPEASAYLVDVLLERARKVGVAYIESVTALDAFEIDDERLCAWDLGIVYDLAEQGVVERMGPGDSEGVVATYPIGERGNVCMPMQRSNGYHVARLRVRRDDQVRPVMQVHYKSGKNARVLGIVRAEDGPCVKGRGRPRCL